MTSKYFRGLTLSFALAASALASAANYANEVLAIGAGARALAMGGAFVGLADDSTAVYWNPAGLVRIPNMEFAASEQVSRESLGLNELGSQYIFLSGAVTAPHLGSFGAAFMHFGVGGIPQVSGLNSDGSPHEIGTFSSADNGLLAGYGMRVLPSLSAGASLKWIGGGTSGLVAGSGVLGDATYSYAGLDLGLMVDFGALAKAVQGLSLGLNFQDLLNTGVSWKNTASSPTDAVTLNPKLGLGYQPDLMFLRSTGSRMSLAFDVDPRYGSNMLYHLGGEFWYRETLAFRAGLRQFAGGLQGTEWTLGLAFHIFMMQIDYAFINYELTPVHYLSLNIKLPGASGARAGR